MSDISFTCPHCKQHLDAPPEMAGDQLACPTCQKQIRVPTAAPVKLTSQRGRLAGRLAAGLVGGFILAFLAAHISSMLFGNATANEDSAAVTAVSWIMFFGLWAASVVFAIKANRAAKAWRRLLISTACLSFALPIAGFIMAGKATYHFGTKGHQLEAAAMATAGGFVVIFLAILGFFLGAIFLTVGLLVGRDKPKME